MEKQRVHIVGFKRAGTTLLQQLFRCFKDTHVATARGVHLWEYQTPANVTESTVVTKFSKDAYFVDKCLEVPESKIIYMIRDPRDTLTSKFNKTGERATNPDKLEHRIKILNEEESNWPSDRLGMLYYEGLVTDPNYVQNNLVQWLGLEIDIPFSEGYTRMQDDTPNQALNGVRPVDTSSIGRWKEPEYREEVEEIVSHYPGMQEFIRRWYPDV